MVHPESGYRPLGHFYDILLTVPGAQKTTLFLGQAWTFFDCAPWHTQGETDQGVANRKEKDEYVGGFSHEEFVRYTFFHWDVDVSCLWKLYSWKMHEAM